jgi:hypothetical protein
MDSALPAIAFLVLILAQFAAVIAVKIHPLADVFPRLQPDRSHPTSQVTNVSQRRIGHA